MITCFSKELGPIEKSHNAGDIRFLALVKFFKRLYFILKVDHLILSLTTRCWTIYHETKINQKGGHPAKDAIKRSGVSYHIKWGNSSCLWRESIRECYCKPLFNNVELLFVNFSQVVSGHENDNSFRLIILILYGSWPEH